MLAGIELLLLLGRPWWAPAEPNGLLAILLNMLLLCLFGGPLLLWRFKRQAAAVGPGRIRRLGAVWLAAMVLLGSLCLTTLVVLAMRAQVQREGQTRFDRMADALARDIREYMARPLYGLNGLRALYASNPDLDGKAFRAYLAAHDLEHEYPGVRAMGWIAPLERDALPAFEAAARRSEPGFAINSLNGDQDLYVVRHIEPQQANRGAWGIDLGGNPERRSLIEFAIDSGLPVLMPYIQLEYKGDGLPSFAYVLPVYRDNADRRSASARRAAITGLVFAPVVIAQLLDQMPSGDISGLNFQLYDGTNPHADHLLYSLDRSDAAPQGRYHFQRILQFEGRNFLLIAHSTHDFEASTVEQAPLWFGAAGSTLGLLLAMLILVLGRGRERAEHRAGEAMSALVQAKAELEVALREAQTMQRTIRQHLIVSVADRQGRIVEVNDAFCALTGYSRAALLGQDHRLLGSGLHDKAFWQSVWQAISQGKPWRGEICNRNAQGEQYWVDSLIAPFPDQNGLVERYVSISTDITVSKGLQQALEQERQYFANVLEGTHAGTWEWQVATGQVHANARWTGMIGYTEAELAPLTVETWRSLLHPADVARTEETLARHFAGETEYYECEFRMRHKLGNWVWILARGSVQSWHAPGKPAWMAGTHTDISVRKLAEQQAQENEAFLEQAGRLTGLGAWQLNLEDMQLHWSAQTRQVFEVDAEQQLTMDDFYSFFAPEVRPQFEQAVQDCISQGTPWDMELPILTGNGLYAWVRVVGEAEYDAAAPDAQAAGRRPLRLAGAAQDITARKRTEEALRATGSLLSAVFDAALDVSIIATGVDGLITVFNRGAQHLLGYSADEVVGKESATLFHLQGELVQRAERCSAEVGFELDTEGVLYAKADQGITEPEEWTYVRKDGSQFTAVVIVSAMRTDEGALIGHLAVGYDNTARKEYERSLQQAKEQAEQATLAKSQFLANMSHEIRTPMNAIIGMLQLLQYTEQTAQQQDYSSKAEIAAKSLLGIINDILDFSKVEAGKMTLDLHPFRPAQLVRELAVILGASVGSKPVQLQFDIDADLPAALLGDDLRLQQVLVNLAGNAVKFTERGQVVVAIKVLARSNDSVQVQFAVRDTGIGMTVEQMGRVFEGFAQAEAATTRRFGGTGLGLAISRSLVEMMGGEISLRSEPNVGSEFSFSLDMALAELPELELPAEAVPAAIAAPAKPSTPPWQVLAAPALPEPLGQLRCLVIDDNDTVCDTVMTMAQGMGWLAEACTDGAQGVQRITDQAAAGQPFDVVLVDWQMPGLDGWETSREIRRLGAAGGELIIIMMSSHGMDMLGYRSEREQAMLNGFLVKPLSPDALRESVASARNSQAHLRSRQQAGGRALGLSGVRLLVVEDNVVNQQVAKGLLGREGAIVELAENGELAVAAIARANPQYDVVLMDVQMPVMDGYTATHKIRNVLGLTDLPIIAMTANAMPADRAACLEAGMNEHVGKPFDRARLVALIQRMIAAGGDSGAPQEPAVVEPRPGLTVDRERALKSMMGDTQLYDGLIVEFRRELAGISQQLEWLLQQGSQQEAIRLMHTLKSSAATIGAMPLSDEAARLERLIKEELNAAQISAACESLAHQVDLVLSELERMAEH